MIDGRTIRGLRCGMMPKRKILFAKSNKAKGQALPCGNEVEPNGLPESPNVFDAISALKEQVLKLHGSAHSTEKIFRLSFSILALEKSIEERQLRHIKLDKAPGIGLFIDRLRMELAKIQDIAEPAPSTMTLEANGQAVTVAPPAASFDLIEQTTPVKHVVSNHYLDDSIQEILSIARVLKKNTEAENRKFHASTAAQYSTLQRLSERMGRIEELLATLKPVESEPPLPDQALATLPVAPMAIDPRPLLTAARAAAARALADTQNIAPEPSADRPAEKSSPVPPREPSSGDGRSMRLWKSIFAAA